MGIFSRLRWVWSRRAVVRAGGVLTADGGGSGREDSGRCDPEVTATIPIGGALEGVADNPWTNTGYVTTAASSTVRVI